MMENDDELSRLFQRYRDACPIPEPTAGFFPGLWERIESQRSFVFRLRRYSRNLVTASVAACLLLLGLNAGFLTNSSQAEVSYLEVLEAESGQEALAYADIVPAGFRDDGTLPYK